MLRRNFFKNSSLAGLGILGTKILPAHITDAPLNIAEKKHKLIVPSIWAPQGAVYIPARAYNTYQQWRDYDSKETERDFGYAANLGLNSLLRLAQICSLAVCDGVSVPCINLTPHYLLNCFDKDFYEQKIQIFKY